MARRKRPALDLGRSPSDLLGLGIADDHSEGLPGRWARAMRTPAGDLDVSQLEMLMGQSPSPAELELFVQIAVELLDRDLFAWHARALATDIALHRDVLAQVPGALARAVEVVLAHAHELVVSEDEYNADEVFAAALDIVEHEPRALVALERVFVNTERVEEIRARRLHNAKTSAARIAVLTDLARAAERTDPEAAAWRWLEVIEIDRTHGEAHAEVDRLFTQLAAWDMLAQTLERRAEARLAAGDPAGALDDLVRAADLAATHLDDETLVDRLAARLAAVRDLLPR